MKIGEAHRTQSSSLCSANTIGAPMHPAPIGVADRTGKKSAKHNLNIIGAQCLASIAYWRRGTSVRQYLHRLTVRRLTYFHTNRLLTGLYRTKTEIRWRKDDGPIKNKQTSITMVRYPILSVLRLPTLQIFRYPLPLTGSFQNLKGTQAWEIFGLQFWVIDYFIVSYA
jgi:hypothetical protein